MHALIVDDSATMRMILREHLKKLGFQITEAVNGVDALIQLRKMETTDLVLVDCNMPEMDGLSFVRAVRAEHAYERLPLMMVTTNSETTDISRAMAAGADEYLKKPFTSAMIREKLTALGLLRA